MQRLVPSNIRPFSLSGSFVTLVVGCGPIVSIVSVTCAPQGEEKESIPPFHSVSEHASFRGELLQKVLLITALLLMVTATPSIPAVDEAKPPDIAYKQIIALRNGGKTQEALELLNSKISGISSGEIPLSAMVLLATLLEDTGRIEESEAYWNGLVLREPALKTLAVERVARLRLKAKDPTGAENALMNMPDGGFSRSNASLILSIAGAYSKEQNYKKAIFLYRQVIRLSRKSAEADQARLELAEILAWEGDLTGAIEVLRELQLNFHETRRFRNALAMETSFAARTGNLRKAFKEEEYLQIIRRLRDRSDFDAALQMLTEWELSYPESNQRDRLDAERIEIYFRKRDNEQALAYCQRFHKDHPKSDLLSDVFFTELLLYQRLGQTQEVKTLGKEIWKGKHGGRRSQRRNAGFVMAGYLVSIGQITEGLNIYREIYRSGVSTSAKNAILWRVGLGALRGGQYKRAADNLKLLLSKRPRGDDLPATLYWLAVAQEKLGNPLESLKHLIRLEQQFPYHYYGVKAGKLLSKLSVGVDPAWLEQTRKSYQSEPLSFPDLNLNRDVRRNGHYRAAAILSEAGLEKEAAYYYGKLLQRFPKDDAVALLAARAYSLAGEHRQAVRTIYNHFLPYLNKPADGLPNDFWKLYYPRPFLSDVVDATEKNELDHHLMFSLMRQESRFDASARSWVGAIGLFQIMPYTAKEIGPRIGFDTLEEDDLYQPGINIAIAARVADDLLNLFENNAVPTIASYNAGEDRVMAWWRAATQEGISEDLFIDTIPYVETRGFVREVLTNYYAYERIYPGSERKVSEENSKAGKNRKETS